MNAIWDRSQDYIRVALQDIEVDAHVGLHPWEQHRERPTRLLVSIEMFAHTSPKTDHTKSSIVDYDPIRNLLKSWANRPHTPLLETLAEELIDFAFGNSRVEACRVAIMKPDIFNEASAAGIEIYRTRIQG